MKSLRKQLHLTQQQLAALIGVSTSVICMYEKGQRNLPAKASAMITQLQLQLLQPQRLKAVPGRQMLARQQAHLLKVEKVLSLHARKAAADALRISLTLSKMQERYLLLTQKLALIQELIAAAAPATRQMSLLQNMEVDVLDALDRCGPARQLAAEYKLATLKARQQAALQMQGLVQQRSRLLNNLK
ncbi:helix-turn-helix domain-containing protein [Niabella sp. CC-SYL272]|uniref:helix-turn-helix transcriptional regulator n=1 Tax=Niabella agricola TaxID=2891571 RepID=UPI001F38D657|nr:helix-turn-helix transcriptional regulator [Niabella agricola]MCF3110906.1 helix-turn-helix domain-containing protein [Niabella agricola]